MNEYAKMRSTTRYSHLPHEASLEVIRGNLIVLSVEKWPDMEFTDIPQWLREMADDIEQRNTDYLGTLEAVQEHCTCEAEDGRYGPHHDEDCPRWLPF